MVILDAVMTLQGRVLDSCWLTIINSSEGKKKKYIFNFLFFLSGTKEELEELNEEIKKIANKVRARLKGKM